LQSSSPRVCASTPPSRWFVPPAGGLSAAHLHSSAVGSSLERTRPRGTDPPPKEDLMAQYLREIMTQKPVTVQVTDTVVAAARSMRDGNIGDVVGGDNNQIQGIL